MKAFYYVSLSYCKRVLLLILDDYILCQTWICFHSFIECNLCLLAMQHHGNLKCDQVCYPRSRLSEDVSYLVQTAESDRTPYLFISCWQWNIACWLSPSRQCCCLNCLEMSLMFYVGLVTCIFSIVKPVLISHVLKSHLLKTSTSGFPARALCTRIYMY